MIYGKPQLQIIRDTTDLIGIRLLVLSQIWQPSTNNPLDVLKEKPVAPEVPGGVIITGEQTLPSEGAMRTTWTFQGINGDGKSVTFKDREHSIDFGFEPGFAQTPIQLHPDFQTLLDNYSGSAGNDGSGVIWNPTLTSDPAASTGWGRAQKARGNFSDADGKSGGEATNPMFGVQDWFRMEGSYRFRYAARSLPSGFYRNAGKIVQTGDLPGRPPPVGEDRNWLFVPPPYTQKGTILDITELYWLSGRGGWPEPVYGKASVSTGGKWKLELSTLINY